MGGVGRVAGKAMPGSNVQAGLVFFTMKAVKG